MQAAIVAISNTQSKKRKDMATLMQENRRCTRCISPLSLFRPSESDQPTIVRSLSLCRLEDQLFDMTRLKNDHEARADKLARNEHGSFSFRQESPAGATSGDSFLCERKQSALLTD